MVQIHSPRPLLKANNLQRRKVPTTSWLCAAFFTVLDVFEKSFRSENSCRRSHGPSSVAKRQCSQPEEISHRSEHSVIGRDSPDICPAKLLGLVKIAHGV